MAKIQERKLQFQKKCDVKEFFVKENPLIGIHGIKGAFTEQALYRLTQEELEIKESDYSTKELVHSENVLKSVTEGDIDLGIFAFANSRSGGYLASINAMGKYNYRLVALFGMPINMCLIVHPDTDSKDLVEFRGHPVAMTMCRDNLREKYSHIPMNPDTDEMDTALSVELLMKGELPKNVGVFASERAAQIYGAKVLENGIHDDPNNTTFFALVTKS
ncbi:hypothetical protein GF376_01300 [Candidatus Peregrinibacteria bacterium]|nr:hypothetical protein [Candidatus Peregrinibacteria bacterium]